MTRSTGQTIGLVAIMWAAAIAVAVVGARDRGIDGPVKSADFVHFYTLGHLAGSHQISPMYDRAALHAAQVALVPASAPDVYPTVYPPQVAAFFAPVSGWPYQRALLLWNVLTLVAYGVIVWSAWKAVSHRLPHRALAFTAAATFPPLWSLILYGQITILIVAAFWAGWLALERQRPLLAGMAFGLLAIKPQFGLPLVVVVLARREWMMLAGAALSTALQVGFAWLVLGWAAFEGFARTLPITLGNVDLMESKPFLSHSLRAVTRLAPNWLGVPLWFVLVAIVLYYTARIWRSQASLRVRLGAVILASVLVNPHLIVYDATVLVLPLLWFGAYMQEPQRRAQAGQFWKSVTWLYVALFIPTAAVIGLQLSVPVMVWMFALVTRAVFEEAAYQPMNAATLRIRLAG